MVFKAIKTNRSLRIPPKKSEAYLSDLFFILYFIYLNKDRTRSKVNIQKGIVYVLEKLLDNGKLEDIKVFNLPFYRWKYGDYNKYISSGYLPELLEGSLIEEEGKNSYSYITTEKTNKLIKRFEKENASNENLLLIKQIISSYPSENGFMQAFKYSHNRKVKVGEEEKLVDNLETDETVAIAYNSNPENEDGFKSNIFPTNYLLALNSLLEETKLEQNKVEFIDSEIVKKLLEDAGIKE